MQCCNTQWNIDIDRLQQFPVVNDIERHTINTNHGPKIYYKTLQRREEKEKEKIYIQYFMFSILLKALTTHN